MSTKVNNYDHILENFTNCTNNSLTPIRDYKNDFFHANDAQLPPAAITKQSCAAPAEDVSSDELVLSSSTHNLKQCISLLVQEEMKYIDMLTAANEVFRRSLCDKKALKRIIHPGSKEDILLFGNLDTLQSISRIHAQNLSTLTQLSQSGYESSLDQEIYEVFKTLSQRIKGPYSSYVSSYERQIELVTSLENSLNKCISRWLTECRNKCNITLRELLELPIQRLRFWRDSLQDIANLLQGDVVNEVIELQQQYLAVENSCSGQTVAILNPHMKPELHGESHLQRGSVSSSCYSIDEQVQVLKLKESQFPLGQSIKTLRVINCKLKRLKELLAKQVLMSLVDKLLMICKYWNELYSMEPYTEGKYQLSIQRITEVIDNLESQRLSIKTSQRVVFDLVICRIDQILEVIDAINKRIESLRSLKPDYLIYRKEKEMKIHDSKREILAIHYEKMHRKLSKQLPELIGYINLFTELVLQQYIKIVMDSFAIMQNFNVSHSDELTILTEYHADRLHYKKLIRNEWSYPLLPSHSRVIRKFFEL